jgi:hypothetical protein
LRLYIFCSKASEFLVSHLKFPHIPLNNFQAEFQL